jgi:putative DNA primase/helicase
MTTAPMHAANAPEAGSGKSYLFQLAAAIATGFPCPVISSGKDEEELEKRLGAALLAGHALFSIDNISHALGGDCLCQLLDQPLIKVRILGKSAGPLIEPRVCLFATGNNLTLIGDIVRRTVTATMDAGREDPWMRQFNDDPLARIMADRGKYAAAALTVCRAFMVSGEEPLPPLQSFEAWSRVVRSALVWLGTGDPVNTIAKAAADDPERQAFDAVLTAWANIFQETEKPVAEVILRAGEKDTAGDYIHKELRDALLAVAAGKGGEINPHRLGAWMRDHRGRVLGRRCLQRRAGPNKVALWRVVHT